MDPKADLALSRKIAALVGPTLLALVLAELPFVQAGLYEGQVPSGVYLSGALLFVAGLAIVRAHNRWSRSWVVLVTLTGWFALALGLVRLFAASHYRAATAGAGTATLLPQALLIGVAIVLTYQGYRRPPQ
jgi:hypothetical protein